MSEDTYSGFDGYVQTVTNVIAGIRHWTVTITQESEDVSRFRPTASSVARRFRMKKPGVLDWSGSADGFVMPGDAGQQEIKDAIENGTEVSCYFHYSADKYLKGKALMSSEGHDLAWDSVGTLTIEFDGTELIEKIGWS